MQEVELAMMTSSPANWSISENTFCFSLRFSGVHSYNIMMYTQEVLPSLFWSVGKH